MAEVLDLTLSDDEDVAAASAKEASQNATASVKNESQSQSYASRHATIRPRFNNDNREVTTVNGIGFWKSWTRSFKTTLLKLLDLIDNAVDGATTVREEDANDFKGRVHIYPDVYEQHATNRKGRKYRSTTGLCIRNNSAHEIVPLAEALVVHNTTKMDEGEIGENGVGLKQACAALCDLSFVLVKNGSNASIELGIVAKSLQREEGPYLPAFQFFNETEEGKPSLKEQMLSLFSQPKHEDVAQCIAQFGSDVSGGDPSLAAGIEGLCKHFDEICSDFYGSDYVFEVILNKIRHDQEEGLGRRAMDVQQKITVNQLIKDLQQEIPKTYVHIPDSLDFIVGKEKLSFKYWQHRLVEMSVFTVTVGKSVPWQHNFEVSDEHPDSYDLRVFMGFDRYRITDPDVDAETGEKKESKNASLYFYTRTSGRLIKSVSDARHMLGLSSTSTLYASALTILLDDIGGNLPLDPTKQDISFGLENKGAIHEENLLAWIGAVTKFYYNFHLKKFNIQEKVQKKILSAKISQYVDTNLPKEPKSLDDSDFTTFELIFEQYRNTIRIDNKSKEVVGTDTIFRLLKETSNSASQGEQKKRSRSNSQKKKSSKQQSTSDAGKTSKSGKKPSKQQSTSSDTRKTPKRPRSQPASYREESDHESHDEAHKQVSKRSRSQSTAQEESESDHDEETNVKMEAATVCHNTDNNSGCIDLCESSDESDGDGAACSTDKEPSVEKDSHASEESEARDVPDEGHTNDENSQSKSHDAPQEGNQNIEAAGSIHDLKQTIEQLRCESKSKIESLESENKLLQDENQSLKEELDRKDNELKQKEEVIAVLKRRLGA